MNEKTHAHFPEPDEIWKRCIIKGWSFDENGVFVTELTFVSSCLPYCDKAASDRVTKTVGDVITRASAGGITPKEAVELVRVDVLFTKEELQTIDENVKKLGVVVGNFFRKKGEVN